MGSLCPSVPGARKVLWIPELVGTRSTASPSLPQVVWDAVERVPTRFDRSLWSGRLPVVAGRENAIANELKEFLARQRQVSFRRDGFADVNFHLAPPLNQMESPGLCGNQLHVLNENGHD